MLAANLSLHYASQKQLFINYFFYFQAGAAVRILSNLFHAFNKHPRVQHSVFVALVVLCGRARLIGDLDTSTEQLNEYFKKWSLQTEQKRSLLRLIHGALINDGRSDQAAKVRFGIQIFCLKSRC